jgi:hypothetical protein
VSNPRDEIDAWLDADVEPLAPSPGTFERISRRARHRKRNQVIMSAAVAVVVIAAGVALPRLTGTLLRGAPGPSGPVAVASGPPSARPATGSTKSGGTPAARTATPVPTAVPTPGPSLSIAGSGLPVARGFRPTSITLMGPHDGAVIGQADCAGNLCTSLAGTVDYGTSWYGVSAPPAGAPSGAAGVSKLRFLTLQDGWAFGPQLYATANGGSTWTREPTPGNRRVIDLETAGQMAFAMFATCAGGDSNYAVGCTSLSLYSSLAGTTKWQPVQVPAAEQSMTGAAGQAASASLVLVSPSGTGAGTGWLLTPSGTLLSGQLAGGPWTKAGTIPRECQVGQPQQSGQPAGVQLASGTAAGPQLLLSCAGASGGAQTETIYQSATGAHWNKAGTLPLAGAATSLAAAGGGLVVLATSTGISYSVDSGASWQESTFTGPTPAGGFSYVGMTNSSQGVAVPVSPRLGEVFTTADGGQTWSPSVISGG